MPVLKVTSHKESVTDSLYLFTKALTLTGNLNWPALRSVVYICKLRPKYAGYFKRHIRNHWAHFKELALSPSSNLGLRVFCLLFLAELTPVSFFKNFQVPRKSFQPTNLFQIAQFLNKYELENTSGTYIHYARIISPFKANSYYSITGKQLTLILQGVNRVKSSFLQINISPSALVTQDRGIICISVQGNRCAVSECHVWNKYQLILQPKSFHAWNSLTDQLSLDPAILISQTICI